MALTDIVTYDGETAELQFARGGGTVTDAQSANQNEFEIPEVTGGGSDVFILNE